MPQPDRRDARPRYEQIADDLRLAITEGRLQPGDRLPTEREHSARYGVAPGTYRQALAELRREGWLATHKRHGTVVLHPPEETPSHEFVALTQRLDAINTEVNKMASDVTHLTQGVGPEQNIVGRLGQVEADLLAIRREIQDHARLLARIRRGLDKAGIAVADSAGDEADQRDAEAT